VHQTTIQVRWGELDPYNHVNHAVYSSYLEHARVAALESLDSGMQELSESGYQVVVVRSDVRFKAPATAGDELLITSRVTDMTGARMTWRQQITRGSDAVVEAEIQAACLNRAGRPTRIPATLREALSALG
jgi:YbgC/YbaW family acyl-CoA thioester hydrolase